MDYRISRIGLVLLESVVNLSCRRESLQTGFLSLTRNHTCALLQETHEHVAGLVLPGPEEIAAGIDGMQSKLNLLRQP